MPKASKPAYYAVKRGRKSGVYLTWDECNAQVKGYPAAEFKKFLTAEEAQQYINGNSSNQAISKGVKGKGRASSPVTESAGCDVVYSDGACKGNGQVGSVAGVGVWWGPNDPRNIAERCPGDQTNNRAELIAILRILETTPISERPLLIRSDSKYSMDCVTKWLPAWRLKNFKTASGEPVKNLGIIRYIDAHLDMRRQCKQKVTFNYVKGHSGDIGNDGADTQANMGTLLRIVPEPDWEGLERDLRQKIEYLRQTGKSSLRVRDESSSGLGNPSVEEPARRHEVEAVNVSSTVEESRSRKYPAITSLKPSLPSGSLSHHSTTSVGRNTEDGIGVKQSRSLTSNARPVSKPNTSSGDISAEQRRYRTMEVLAVVPPLIPLSADDVNVDDYADCVLEDDDLTRELD